MLGAALQAMLQGGIPGQTNGADFERLRRQRAAQQMQARQVDPQRQQSMLQQLVAQHMGPQATADVRGTFSGGGALMPMDGGDTRAIDRFPQHAQTVPMASTGDPRAQQLHELILQALQMGERRRGGRPVVPMGNGGVAAPPRY